MCGIDGNKLSCKSYRDEKLSPLVREISWTNNLLILSKSNSMKEIGFYLEALDNDVKKAHEKPSIGIIPCKNHDSKVVQYALNRTVSLTLIAKYETELIDKKLLEQKLDEFYMLEEPRVEYKIQKA